MHPTDPPTAPRWRDVRDACGGLQQAMDAMIGQPDFEPFRPGIARAIALARDEKQRADHPDPAGTSIENDADPGRFEAIAAGLAPSDIARAVLGVRACADRIPDENR